MSEYVPPRPDSMHAIPPLPFASVEERPKATWRWWEAIGVYLLGFVLSGFAAMPLVLAIHSEGLAMFMASAASAIVIVGVLLSWLWRFHPTWRGAIGFPKQVWPEVRAGVVVGGLLYPAMVFGFGLVLTLLLDAIAGKTVTVPEQLPSHLSAAGTIVGVAYIVVIAPIHEELFFRGILYRGIRDRYGVWLGILGSSLAFGPIHYIPGSLMGNLLLMSVMACVGGALAYLYERRGNVVANMIAHATFNTIGFALIVLLR